jgi:hypothetical protein
MLESIGLFLFLQRRHFVRSSKGFYFMSCSPTFFVVVMMSRSEKGEKAEFNLNIKYGLELTGKYPK